MPKTILLADDEEGILALLSATLEGDQRYGLLMARDGEEALNICREQKPDVMFLDLRMPKLDGCEVCRALKQDPLTADIKVIVLTAMAQEGDRDKALEAGADDYLTKPFSPRVLLEKATEYLNLN